MLKKKQNGNGPCLCIVNSRAAENFVCSQNYLNKYNWKKVDIWYCVFSKDGTGGINTEKHQRYCNEFSFRQAFVVTGLRNGKTALENISA